MWPAGALLRRRLGVGTELAGAALLGYRLSRLAALLVLVVLAGWTVTIATMFGGTRFGAEFDPLLRTLQITSVLAFGGGLAVLLGNAVLTWRKGRRWSARLWSLALVLAGAVVVWIGTTYHLMGFGSVLY
jgi:hypothetical protein